MSNDGSCQPLEAMSRNNSIFEFLPRVGESLGNSSNFGSRYPRITYLALALVAFPWLDGSSIGFHVKTQRHRKICSGGTCSRSILEMVPVLIQIWTSAILAFLNSSLSAFRIHSKLSLRGGDKEGHVGGIWFILPSLDVLFKERYLTLPG